MRLGISSFIVVTAAFFASAAQAVVVTTYDELVGNIKNNAAITFGTNIVTYKRIEVDGITGLRISGGGFKLTAMSTDNHGLYTQTQVFYIHSGSELVLSDLTISGGWAGGDEPPFHRDDTTGGGLMISESVVALASCVVYNNRAKGNGGGLYISNSNVTISDSELSHNFAQGDGGGLFTTGNSVVTMANCNVVHNEALASAGGVFVSLTQFTMSASNVSYNTAEGYPYGGGGGGFLLAPGSPLPISIMSTVIANNNVDNSDYPAQKYYGGAIQNIADYSKSSVISITVAGCIFESNSAPNGGDDIFNLAYYAPDDTYFKVYSACDEPNEFNAGTGLLSCFTCSDAMSTNCGACPTSYPANTYSDGSEACAACTSGTQSCCGALECQAGTPTCSGTQKELCA